MSPDVTLMLDDGSANSRACPPLAGTTEFDRLILKPKPPCVVLAVSFSTRYLDCYLRVG